MAVSRGERTMPDLQTQFSKKEGPCVTGCSQKEKRLACQANRGEVDEDETEGHKENGRQMTAY